MFSMHRVNLSSSSARAAVLLRQHHNSSSSAAALVPNEADFLRSVYKRFHGPVFTLIKVGGEVVDNELEPLVETCLKLQADGMQPIVIHGGGPQLNDELKLRGVEPNYVRGHRVTDVATLDVAQAVFTRLNEKVVSALNKDAPEGAPAAVGFSRGIFNAQQSQHKELGLVGEITGINKGKLREALANNSIPVLTSLGTADDGQLLNINADVAARELALWLKPQRTFFTSAKGGWIDDDTKELVNVIDLSRDYEGLANRDYTGRQGTLLKLNEIKDLLDALPSTSSVAITSATAIKDELFTTTGAGTLFLKGEPISQATKLDVASHSRLFGSDYVTSKQSGTGSQQVLTVFANEANDTGAVVLRGPSLADGSNVPVVDKIVTTADGYTNKLNSLWGAVRATYPDAAVWPVVDYSHASLRHTAEVVKSTGSDTAPVAAYGLDDAALDAVVSELTTSFDSFGASNAAEASKVMRPLGRPSKVKIGLLGARGYVGGEFAKLLVQHDDMELVAASSRALKGTNVLDGFGLPRDSANIDPALNFVSLEPDQVANDAVAPSVDVWVLALPNGLAPPFEKPLRAIGADANQGTGSLLIDLGADYRFDDSGEWVYGLAERPGAREALYGARAISNPGCYATGTQVGLMPLVQFGSDRVSASGAYPPSVFGVSGYSGAGTTPSDKNNPEKLNNNILAYASVNHIHERECSRHLGAQVAFMPHVGQFFQGIHLTMTVPLARSANGSVPNADEILEHFASFYDQDPLVRVKREAPCVADVMCKHHVEVGGFTVDPINARVAYVVTIDNLLKGAATQAVQNINLALGLDEYKGFSY
jgi:N-acetyl-gamma-glutamyl-phosphate reductase/acetylglutamate kinase